MYQEHGDGKLSFTYTYARPALAVDCVVLGLDDAGLNFGTRASALFQAKGDVLGDV